MLEPIFKVKKVEIYAQVFCETMIIDDGIKRFVIINAALNTL